MSKNHRENRKPRTADWLVHFTGSPGGAVVTESRFTRDRDGGYTFTDKDGVTADFPPGTVLHVMRREPEPEPETALSPDGIQAYDLAGALDSRA